jgi:DNA-binding NtrC family response regulator
MPHLPRILIVTAHVDTFDAIRTLLSGDAELLVVNEPGQALRLIAERDYHAVVADNRLADGKGRVIVDAFMNRSPQGRAVLLASLLDPDTLMRLDIRSHRLEVIFRPWNDWELRTCLLGPTLEATGTA